MSPRGFFMGRTSLGPEDVSPAVPADSPRLAENRQSTEELRADEILARLGMVWVKDPHGNIVRVSSRQPIKAGWHVVGPAGPQSEDDLDVPLEYFDHAAGAIATTTRRAELAKSLDNQARELRAGPYYTGRRLNMLSEGEGVIREVADDSTMAIPHGQRSDPFGAKGGK